MWVSWVVARRLIVGLLLAAFAFLGLELFARRQTSDPPEERFGTRRLLDHLIRPLQERLRDREAQRLGAIEVNDQIKPCGLFRRQLGRPCPSQDLCHEGSCPAPQLATIRPVGHQATGPVGEAVTGLQGVRDLFMRILPSDEVA